MSERDDGGSAFPTSGERGAYGDRSYHPAEMPGMTLLDYFAAASFPLVALAMEDTPRREGITIGQHAAEIAYAIAARMLAERAK